MRHLCPVTVPAMLLICCGALGVDEAELDARGRWLAENAVVVRTIDPADEDFADLQQLKELIGDSRVVALGEQSHGDGATFHAKTRLVKFLHQEMGFDVLVWESGMFDCMQVQQAIEAGMPVKEAVELGVFPIWTLSEQVQPLLEYVQRTQQMERPLITAGMDSQITGQQFGPALLKKLEAIEPQLVDDNEAMLVLPIVKAMLGKLSARAFQPSEEQQREFEAAAHTLKGILEQDSIIEDERERVLWQGIMRNLIAGERSLYWATQPVRTQSTMMRSALAREPAMAATLIWLANEWYPDRKLIVWAASSHLMHNSRSVEFQNPDGTWRYDTDPFHPMGNMVREALGEDVYTVGFIAYDGVAGKFGRRWPIPPPLQGSLDDICHRSGREFLFVDLRTLPDKEGGGWLRERMAARPRGYAVMRTNWASVCDAMFYTQTMFPSEPVGQPGE